jgi:hypothetical protein
MKIKLLSVIRFLFSVIGILFISFLFIGLKLITEVNASVDSSVTTNVSAEGSSTSVSVENNVNSSSTSNTTIHKRIEIDVNGQKKVVESDQPGNTSVQVNTNGTNASPTIVITETPNKPSTPAPNKQDINNLVQQFMNNLKKEIDALMKSIFGNR